jgi:hypothetical protein
MTYWLLHTAITALAFYCLGAHRERQDWKAGRR